MKLCNKKICVVTGSRADYGMLEPIIQELECSVYTNLYLVVTGEHLAYRNMEYLKDIVTKRGAIKRVEMLLDSSTKLGMSKSIGLGVISFSDMFYNISPKVVVLLGDRFEILSAAIAAYTLGIPIAHLRGGEVSGALDNGYRHAITQLATYHFTSNEEHSERIVKMGKLEENVFTVGDTAYLPDSVIRNDKVMMLVYHPVTDSPDYGLRHLDNLLLFLEYQLIHYVDYIYVSGTNKDAGAALIEDRLRKFVNKHDNVEFNQNLGHNKFVSLLAQVGAIVGNSSAGLSIAPSLGIGIINVGTRQKDRITAPSVIPCEGDRESICKAFETLRSEEYKAILPLKYNPYRCGDAAKEVVEILLSRI